MSNYDVKDMNQARRRSTRSYRMGPNGKCPFCAPSANDLKKNALWLVYVCQPACMSRQKLATWPALCRPAARTLFWWLQIRFPPRMIVAASLITHYEIPVFAIKGEDNATYYKHLKAALAHKPQITMDDGARSGFHTAQGNTVSCFLKFWAAQKKPPPVSSACAPWLLTKP